MILDRYLNTYVDRRMELLIDEWQLTTHLDVSDILSRVRRIEEETAERRAGYAALEARLSTMEKRIAEMKEKSS